MNIPPAKFDHAAVFSIALSLRKACERSEAASPSLNLGKSYDGWDQFIREIMRVAMIFEEWSCQYVAFDQMSYTWSYFLEDNFGEACLNIMSADMLSKFDQEHCLCVAYVMQLPVWSGGELLIQEA